LEFHAFEGCVMHGQWQGSKKIFIDRPTSYYEELVIKTLVSTTDFSWWFQSYDMWNITPDLSCWCLRHHATSGH
jgi:hypothetical protein